MVNKLFILILLFIFPSCNNNVHLTYYTDGNLKNKKIYINPKDTSYYNFIYYYPNGIIKEKGEIWNSKKEGAWEEYYKDGVFKRSIFYKNGIMNFSNRKRELPILNFESDSLKVGVSTKIKAINFYPDEALSCDNGIVSSFGGKDDFFDFVVTPEKKDSIHFFYYNPDLSANDTIELSASEIEDPSKYGLSKSAIENNALVVIITKKQIPTPLVTLPVYE